MRLSRNFEWVSSNESVNESTLAELHNKMTVFYNCEATRSKHHQLIAVEETEMPDSPISDAFISWFKQGHFSNIVEIGCGNGRIWHFLQKHVKAGMYTGIEVDEVSVSKNALRWPTEKWIRADAYSFPVSDGTVDLLMSFYVLEHLVYPVKAMENRFRKLPTATIAYGPHQEVGSSRWV